MNDREKVSLEDLAPEVGAPPANRRRGPRFNLVTGTLLLSAIALVGGFLIVNLVLMPSLTRQGEEVRVPDLVGLSEREAERSLAGGELRLSKISEQWSPDVPRGYVSRQDPEPGSVVKRGRRISVVMSLGAQGTTVPVVDGESIQRAEIMLEGAGLRRGRLARVYTDEAPRDMVVASDPPGETVVQQEIAVDLLVSMGSLPRGYVLPELTGREVVPVARALRDEGFVVVTRAGGPRQKSGFVAGQEPAAGSRVAPRDSIVLYANP
ncbi:MAG: PASTA domain-containing protein [Candidatus Eisenbacteria bacterium]